ncbi:MULTISPECIES: urease accessory protein UreD [Brenneria]|uniref:Urease accessory protein UreD n=1 Tax=Brenneria nigrifluens DSM 30175 = ATCC 13028 TaxID=1121120 RepID=A0A2U1UTM1_9GAMM|nr:MULTISPECIES: urease accessory protein UreD [Brenneria]EHD19774.1 Urease accessory protein ureD [Brenneria sp. EniD312]PWC24970.1 urease accessory protein [Brenneria nigrifluens] [Brenneria nigrifluens DSM 30175 = ATCC 13028]QCR03033.1 urease accessory protein UreD [Brenneria nigrifluens DSM 30175 = ATCC 13028]
MFSSDNGTTITADKTPAGWRASLYLGLRRQSGRTVVAERRHSGPLLIQRPFYPEGETCHVYLLHPPGGVVGGDRLGVEICLAPEARALITTPGATKFYRSAGETARLQQTFRLASGSCLEWLPQDTIVFPGARAQADTCFHLENDARLIAWETFCLGRPVMREIFASGELKTRLRVLRDGALTLHETLRILDGDLDCLAGHALVGTMLMTPAGPETLEKARALLASSALPAGATLLDGLLVVRMLAGDNRQMQSLQQALWFGLRGAIVGLPPLPPRIWST